MSDTLGMSVLLEDPSDLAVHLALIAGVLAEVLDQTQPDMLQRARYSAGVIARDLPVPLARRIQQALAHLKVPTFLVPEAEMTAVPRSQRLGLLDVRPDGLRIQPFMKAEDPEHVAWDDVLAINAWAMATSNPSDDLREALPRRGGNSAKLSPDTKRMIEELRAFEERERAVVQLGLDLLLAGPRLFRVRCEDPGIYAALEPRDAADPIEVSFADLAGFVLDNPDGPDWSAFQGSTVAWEGVVDQVDAEAGVLRIKPKRKAKQGVRLTLRDPADIAVRDVAPGVTVAYLARLDACLRDEGLFTATDGQFPLATTAVGNYLALIRKLVREGAGRTYLAKPTLRFAERCDFTDILYAKREERDGIHAWIMQALVHDVDDVEDSELTDSDVALVVGDAGSDFDDVDDLDDAELEDDPEDVDDDEFMDDVSGDGSADAVDDGSADFVDDGSADFVDDAEELTGADAGSGDRVEEGSDTTLKLDDVEVPDHDDAPPLPRPLSTRFGQLTDIGELDAELSAAMDHIAGKSARLSREHIQEMIAAAESLESLHDSLLESLEGELGELDDELKEAMSFFDVAKSGKWKLADILGADAEIDEDEAQA